MEKAIAIIPARYASERLPGKPLLEIAGKPLIQHVWENALNSKYLKRVIIATDDKRISNACREFGAEYILTPSDLPSGTDRIAFAINEIADDSDVILNIQGDEPLITGEVIDKLLSAFIPSDSDVGTMVKKASGKAEIFNPSVVKVVMDNNSNALYFSRSSIPYIRDVAHESWPERDIFMKHIGIYAYKKDALNKFTELPQSELEKLEKLEQLRLLQHGYKYLCVETDAELFGVDTEEDLENVRKYFKSHNL